MGLGAYDFDARGDALQAYLAAQGSAQPGYVEQEFEDYRKCGRLEHGFLRVRCETCHAEHLVAAPSGSARWRR